MTEQYKFKIIKVRNREVNTKKENNINNNKEPLKDQNRARDMRMQFNFSIKLYISYKNQ